MAAMTTHAPTPKKKSNATAITAASAAGGGGAGGGGVPHPVAYDVYPELSDAPASARTGSVAAE